MKKDHSTNRFLWFEYIAVSIIVIAFFVISYCGFFTWDDIYMNYGVSSLSDVFEHTKMFYFTYGGRWFSVASQYLFCGVLGNNRIWFAIVNTLFFVLLIMTCGKLIDKGKKLYFHYVLMFALLFWFLCPIPRETLFLTAVSTTYLWANTLSFVFLLFFQKYKDDNFKVVGKLGLFIMSFFAAAEFITCASICGAFVVYYVFHIKQFKGNAVPLVVGFIIGSMIVLFAPGGFARASQNSFSFLSNVQNFAHHPVREMVKYKVLWMFLVVFVWGWTKDKSVVKIWTKKNSILLLSLGWSIIAFSMVFMPTNRALFFPETISLALLLKFLFDNYQIFKIRIFKESIRSGLYVVKSAILLLFVVFIVDTVFAITETKKQSKNNDKLLEEIADSEGVVVLNRMISSHRMAYIPMVAPWSVEPLAAKFGLDSLHIYPHYCQDKYYEQAPPMNNVYIDEINYENDNNAFGKFKNVQLIVRVESECFQKQNNHVTFTIDYSRPHRWYKSWLDKQYNYQYDRSVVVERDNPDVCFDGYCYYVIWFNQENNLKSVKYTIE